MCVGGGTERPAGFYCDLHFNFADVFYPICSHPTCVPGVGGEGLHFELQKTLPPPPSVFKHAGTSHPGSCPLLFPREPPFPWADASVSINYPSAGKKFHGKCAAFTGLKVVACCCSLVTVIVLKLQQEQNRRSSLFCLNPTIWTVGALFNTF